MAIESNQSRLVQDYEAIRRRESRLITDVIEILPKINDLPQNLTTQARDALFHADHPFLMVFVGPFSSGKSSLINALLGSDSILKVGPIPTTDRISILRWGEKPQHMDSGGSEADTVFHPAELLQKVSFVDTPGLESVFQRHEDMTKRFLHRSDNVFLVMLATQAMTSSNLEYMRNLRDYGKKIIILINQVDLLQEEDRKTVKDYVADQSLSKLGYQPDIFLVSGKLGLQARQGDELNEELWKESGLDQIEQYINTQLKDVDRLRQKLQTPVQIMQNVTTNALRALTTGQTVLDQYQNITNNIDEQLASQKREQEKKVREIEDELRDKFNDATERGSVAIREIFRFSRVFSSLGIGITELVGLAGLFRRGSQPKYITTAFQKQKAFEPLLELPAVVDKLGPRLEGRDVQDIDDLVKYGRQEVTKLPDSIREKLIGDIQAPMQYDRRALHDVRADLEAIENEAQKVEVESLTQTVRSLLIYVALYEFVLLVFGAVALASGVGQSDSQLLIMMLILLIGLALAGLAFIPIMGRVFENRYASRMESFETRYLTALKQSAAAQIEYSMRLRRDAIAPLTRLITAQTKIHNEQVDRIRQTEQEMTQIEVDLNKLGRRNVLGIGK